MPARSRVARCSVAALGDQNWPAQPVRAAAGSPGLASNHWARSQPLPSKKTAPSASSRSWNGASRSGRATPRGWTGWMRS